jgi:hypothetical protein
VRGGPAGSAGQRGRAGRQQQRLKPPALLLSASYPNRLTGGWPFGKPSRRAGRHRCAAVRLLASQTLM